MRFYGVDSDDVPLSDMWDMVLSLPRGSRTLALADPETEWTEEAYILADIYDVLVAMACGLGGEKPPKPRRRPGDATTEQERRRSSAVRDRIIGTEWKEMA